MPKDEKIDLQTADMKSLKSWAFDQLVLLEQTKNNLALINQQILKVQSEAKVEAKPE